MFNNILSFALFFLVMAGAQASYHVATYQTEGLNLSAPTRILVTGKGDDLGMLFIEVAKAKAVKYAEKKNKEQIVLIATEEEDSEASLKRFGFKIISEGRKTLDGEKLLEEMVKFQKILSLDVFSHSSDQFGVHLDGRANRLNAQTKGLEVLRSHFTKGAYVYLHGCNTGFSFAPLLSRVWSVPVAGSMTSTNFQKLHNDGNFYLTEEGYPPNSDWASNNTLSFNLPLECKKGVCLRLKPDNTPYVGFWGEYREGGLPFYKFFCAKNDRETCLAAMAHSMLSHSLTVNLKKEDSFVQYKKAVVDFLCPVSSKKDLRGECEAKLEESLVTKDLTYNPFSRPQIECDLKSCQAEIQCKKVIIKRVPRPGTCHLENKASGKATTLAREYALYLEAYKYLAK